MSKGWHRLKHYLRHDFREIVNPTSLPNPPEYVPPRKVTWSEFWKSIQAANTKYWESWQPRQETQQDYASQAKSSDGLLKDELSQTARAAMQRGQGLKPMLQNIYETRARSYRDAIQEFVEGYKEGYVGQPIAKASNPNEARSNSEKVLPDGELSSQPAQDVSHSQQAKPGV